jgi:hypothetical protein
LCTTGTVLSPQRRTAVLGIARAAGAFVVEDDFARRLAHADSPPLPLPLAADDPDGIVVHVRSLTKAASPSLRIGALSARGHLAGQQPAGSGPRPAPAGPADPQPTHQRLERQRVMALSSSGNAGQRPTSGIGQQMNLRAQPAAGTPQRFPISTLHFRRRRIPVIRPSPL